MTPMLPIHPRTVRERWLVQKIRGGDARAFGQMYDDCAPRVFGMLRRLCHSADEAEDVTQETFLAAPDALVTWRGDSSLSTFLCGIAYRKWARHRRDDRPTLPLDDADNVTDDRGDPVLHLSRQELSRALETAIGDLPDELRAVFVLVRIEEMAYRDAAQILEIPLGTVQSRLHRAHRLLRVALSASVSEPEPVALPSIPSRAVIMPQEKGAAAHVLD